QVVEDARRDQRLVALNIDDDVGVDRLGRLSHAVGASLVRGARHDGAAAEHARRLGDLDVARRDADIGEATVHPGTAEHVLDHRKPGDESQRLARKSRRSHPRRNDSDDTYRSMAHDTPSVLTAAMRLLQAWPRNMKSTLTARNV